MLSSIAFPMVSFAGKSIPDDGNGHARELLSRNPDR
jgi:hypothetical protein